MCNSTDKYVRIVGKFVREKERKKEKMSSKLVIQVKNLIFMMMLNNRID